MSLNVGFSYWFFQIQAMDPRPGRRVNEKKGRVNMSKVSREGMVFAKKQRARAMGIIRGIQKIPRDKNKLGH